jgi:hypothetical protein
MKDELDFTPGTYLKYLPGALFMAMLVGGGLMIDSSNGGPPRYAEQLSLSRHDPPSLGDIRNVMDQRRAALAAAPRKQIFSEPWAAKVRPEELEPDDL